MGKFPNREDLKNKYVEEDGFDRDVQLNQTEESKTFAWIRLYLNEEDDVLEPGDEITLEYTPSGEKMNIIFATYNKAGLDKDKDGDWVVDYTPEEDKKVLCLMVDINEVNTNDSIPFLRTLFRQGKWYEHQLLKRGDLKFVCKDKDKEFDYYSVDF